MHNPNRERTALLVNVIVLCMITLAAAAMTAFFYMRMRRSDAEIQLMNDRLYGTASQEKDLYTKGELESRQENARIAGETTGEENIRESLRTALEDGSSTISALRQIYPDDIVVASEGRYYFYPRSSEIEENPFHDGDWSLDADGILTYQGDDANVQTLQGITVTDRAEEIDWEAVAADHVDYVMIDLGGRGENGHFEQSAWWEEYLSEARNAGLTVGICYELNVTDAEEAEEDAAYLAQILEPYVDEIDGYAAVMIHMPGEEDRTRELDKESRTAAIKAIADTLQKAGLQPILYESVTAMMLLTDPEQTLGIARWVAQEGAELYFPYTLTMWQYAASAEVDGISGTVARSVWITTK